MSKLKKIRTKLGLTQEELADKSGISVRTIQRIETGLSPGSAYTIKTLAKTLDVSIKDILQADDFESSEVIGIRKVKLMNLAGLSLAFFPFGNIIFPSIAFSLNKRNSVVDKLGRKILSFQILLTIFAFLTLIICGLIYGRGNGAIPTPVTYTYCVFIPINFLVILLTAVNLNRGKKILEFVPKLF